MYPSNRTSDLPPSKERRVFVVGAGRLPHSNNSKKGPSVRELATSFFKKSSIYALNQIGNSKTTRRKIFWAFILIGGLVGCCSQVYRYLSAYYEYPVVINIDSVNLFNQKFPGVTVCNLNSIRSQYLKCVYDKSEVGTCVPDPDFESGPNELMSAVNWPEENCLQKEEISPDYLNRMMLLPLTRGLQDASRKAYGHQASDMIRSCTFNGETCSVSNFTHSLDDSFGNCFTFSAAGETAFVGPNSGLTLEMNVEAEVYTWLSQSVGARVIVHDPNHLPDPQAAGVNVSPGFETSIGLSKVMMVRLPAPYKDECRDYTGKRECDAACRAERVTKACGCAEARCSSVDALCCVRRASRNASDDCHCPLECRAADYELKLSSGVWPARPENLGPLQPAAKGLEDIRETWVKVKVFFDTLEQLTYEQKAMFEDSEVLSQIGGQMGLWLGLSLAAMFECLENIVLLWHYRSSSSSSKH